MKFGNSISTLSGGKFKKLNSNNIDKSMFNIFSNYAMPLTIALLCVMITSEVFRSHLYSAIAPLIESNRILNIPVLPDFQPKFGTFVPIFI
jgi:hypothetical protein